LEFIASDVAGTDAQDTMSAETLSQRIAGTPRRGITMKTKASSKVRRKEFASALNG